MRALRGTYDLLYVAPEQLNSDAFSQLVLSGRISFVAVDEAHCVVDWGRSFRPAYRAIRNYVPDGVQIAALTATATARTRRGIKSVLRLREPVEIVTGFDRPNIRFSVRLNVNRRVTLNSILGSTKAACILYCMTRRSAVLWSSWLNASKIPASVYHGGLDQSDRERGQAEWLGGHTRVMVATSAFGMGIDKADVRTVVHLGMPGSLSAYYQEAGRAGRDGAPADAILLMRAADAVLQKTMIESTYRRQRADTQRQVRIRARRARASALRELREMNRYALGTRCRRQSMLTHFGEFYRPHCGACDNCASDANAGDAARPSDDVAREMIRTIREGQVTWGRLPLMTSTQQRIVSGLVQGNRIAPPIDLDGPIVIC